MNSSANIVLIAGLGNPGEKYESTRHNAGFLTLDIVADRLGANYWKQECGSLVAHVSRTDAQGKTQQILLAKPQSFMNTSGGPILQLMKKYGVEPENLIVIHDELDIEPSAIRVKFGGGHAGHNGLRSICEKLGTNQWARIRVGIGRPLGRMSVSDFVLRVPASDLAIEFAQTCQRGADAVLFLLDHSIAQTQNEFN